MYQLRLHFVPSGKSTKAKIGTSKAKWVQPLPAASGDALRPTA